MASIVFWWIAIAVSAAALVASAVARGTGDVMVYVHFAIAAGTSAVFAWAAIRSLRALAAESASRSPVAAQNAQAMGLVWSWGALALIGTYGTGLLVWKEWWQFAVAFAAAAGLCLGFSAVLHTDARKGEEDEAMLKLARTLAIVQLAGMVLVVAGLLAEGKMTRFLNPRYTDWAANDIFLCGALALAVLSGYALGRRR